MIKSVIKWMQVPVKVHKFVRYDSDGATKLTGAAIDYKCLPSYEEKTVTTTKGKVINTNLQLFMARTTEVNELDVIEFMGLMYDIKSLNGFYGGKTTGLWVVVL